MDTMISVDRMISGEPLGRVDFATAVRNRRLGLNMSQENLADRSGVPLATIKRFEQTGKVSLVSFVEICRALGVGERLHDLIPPAPPTSLDEADGKRTKPLRKRASPRARQK